VLVMVSYAVYSVGLRPLVNCDNKILVDTTWEMKAPESRWTTLRYLRLIVIRGTDIHINHALRFYLQSPPNTLTCNRNAYSPCPLSVSETLLQILRPKLPRAQSSSTNGSATRG
jgi:hypothetical protein